MIVHGPCGAEVALVGGAVYDRVMRAGAGGELAPVGHLCRDYVDWHRPAPDRRDPHLLDLPAAWQPAGGVS